MASIKYWDGSSWQTAVLPDGVEIYHADSNGWVLAQDVFYGFEDMSPWTVNVGSQNNQKTYESKNSFFVDDRGPSQYVAKATPYPDGNKISKLTFWYWEREYSSTGGGIQLYDDSGDYVFGVATDNPEIDADDGVNGITELFNPLGYGEYQDYNKWYQIRLLFDWPNSQVTVKWRDPESTDTFDFGENPMNLHSGSNVSRIELRSYNGGSWSGSGIDMYFDNINIIKG